VIKLEAKLATHVASKKGILGRAVDTVKGTAQGNVPEINSIRELSMEELAECEYSVFTTCVKSILIDYRAPDTPEVLSFVAL
jgi:hypothetical protein